MIQQLARKLRILVVNNLYPPYYVGGYELGCRDVVEGLKARGHDVKVLTSMYGVGEPQIAEGVYRWLVADLGWDWSGWHLNHFRLVRKETTNQKAFHHLCTFFKPDVIYIWNLTHISISIAYGAQEMGIPTCYFVSDNWLLYWENDSWYRNAARFHRTLGWTFVRRLLRVCGLPDVSGPVALPHVQFASEYLRQVAVQAGKPMAGGKVIHWGVDIRQYPYREISRGLKRLLYVGQLVQHKGIHTAVEALKLITQQQGCECATLTIVGGAMIAEYEVQIRRLVASLGLEGNVAFTGLVPRERMPSIYQENEVLIFPSIWDEPFSLTLLEAMASGLAVVGTATGGSSEVLHHGVNALVFPKEDAEACATQILLLMRDSALFERIRQNARRTVEGRFSLERMMDEVEESLYEAVE